jgi:hypothetical protein
VTTDPVVAAALAAIAARDWTRLTPLLHPYLHWSVHGTTIRGRTNVLTHLAGQPVPGPPGTVELRDGQIYRWG